MAKTALVTGGSSGLGLEIARQLGKDGYNIVIGARNQERMDKAVESLKADGIKASNVPCDVTSEEQLRAAADKIKTEHGSIDYLVLNAGEVSVKLLRDYESVKAIKHDIDIDLVGTIVSAHIFLPLLKRGSKIMMVSSGFGLMGAAGYTTYCAAKAGIINFAEALRRELLDEGINVYVCVPGDMDTPQFHNEQAKQPDWLKDDSPRKLMTAEETAKKALAQCKGSKKFLVVTSGDVNSLVILSKLLPRKIRDGILDGMFPRPKVKA